MTAEAKTIVRAVTTYFEVDDEEFEESLIKDIESYANQRARTIVEKAVCFNGSKPCSRLNPHPNQRATKRINPYIPV